MKTRPFVSDWYDYDFLTHQLTPKKQVYVLPRRDGQGSIKLQIAGYYKSGVSGHFTVRWAALP